MDALCGYFNSLSQQGVFALNLGFFGFGFRFIAQFHQRLEGDFAMVVEKGSNPNGA